MTIHTENPFLPADDERSLLRRFRGRLAAPVTVWSAWDGHGRPVGLTVSSMLVADGSPGELLALVDPDSDLVAAISAQRRVTVSLLGSEHQHLAEVMAGLAPSPGGPFSTGTWEDTDFGPVLADAVAWIGADLVDETTQVGWSTLVRATVATVHMGDGDALSLFRGRSEAR